MNDLFRENTETKLRNSFDELRRQLAEYDMAIDDVFLHGLLTGCATIPHVNLKKIFQEVSPGQPLAESVREATIDAVDDLSEALSVHSFQTRFDVHRGAECERWLDGYLKAVDLHEAQWEEQNELHPEAGATLIMLNALNNEELRRGLDMDLPQPADLIKYPELVTNMVRHIYQDFRSDVDDDFDMFDDDDLEPALAIPEQELTDMDEEELFALVVACDDELWLEVVYECARRGEAMAPLLREHLEDAANWADSVDESDRWALLHAVHILGLIPGRAASDALLIAFRRITFDEDNDLADWLSSHWPALCQNKTEFTTGPLRQIAEDDKLRWYPRCQAINCVLADAEESNSAELEKAIDWLAALCGDESGDVEFRVIAGHTLIDYPRERCRAVIDRLVELQQPQSLVEYAYTKDDIQDAFDAGDNPEWRRFSNPWEFYDPDEIRRRRLRWLREDDDFDAELRGTYVRQQPKVGRNEPCPCGSGRKYKKCCME